MAQRHHNYQPELSAFPLDPLYCSEEHLEDDDVASIGFFQVQQPDEEDQVSEISCYMNNNNNNINNSTVLSHIRLRKPLILLEQDLFWENEELVTLLSKEHQNELHSTLHTNPSHSGSRREAVDWMLKVVSHYSFSALTAILAVDYLDRFLSSFHFQSEKPWMTQLAAVACISLAAKVEETQVPMLLDLQVEDCKYFFEAKTIKKMELLVLSTLEWKMNPVTPLSFLDFITRRLGLKDHLCFEFLRRCEWIVVSLVSDGRSMRFLPSVVASATMLHVVNGIEPCLRLQYQTQLLGILRIDKDKVEDCCKIIFELAKNQSKKRKFGVINPYPGSPNRVMDLSFSSDSSNDSWAVASSSSSSVSTSPEPLPKKKTTNLAQTTDLDQPVHTKTTSDLLCLPR